MVANVAVTDRDWDIDTVQEPATPLQPPLHPSNADPGCGDSVRVTCVPASNAASSALPQSIPYGLLAAEPAPDPPIVTSS